MPIYKAVPDAYVHPGSGVYQLYWTGGTYSTAKNLPGGLQVAFSAASYTNSPQLRLSYPGGANITLYPWNMSAPDASAETYGVNYTLPSTGWVDIPSIVVDAAYKLHRCIINLRGALRDNWTLDIFVNGSGEACMSCMYARPADVYNP